jgi:D-glycero-D-manno-heptose 1,7-bisphosphate phosphatase
MIQRSSGPLSNSEYIIDIQGGILSFRRASHGDSGLKPTVFLDRDGVLNRHIAGGYVTRWSEFEILPGVPKALQTLQNAGFRLVIVSNQAGVPKGFLTCDDLIHITSMSLKNLEEGGAAVDGAFFCLHQASDDCSCRKPKPGLLRVAADFFPTDFSRSYLIGDSLSDILAGAAVSCKTIYLTATSDPSVPATYQARNLAEAACWITSGQSADSDEATHKRSTKSQ